MAFQIRMAGIYSCGEMFVATYGVISEGAGRRDEDIVIASLIVMVIQGPKEREP